MHIRKLSYRDSKGRVRRKSRWYVCFVDHLEVMRRMPGFEDRGDTEQFGQLVQRLVALRCLGQHDEPETLALVASLPPAMLERLAARDLISRRLVSRALPVGSLVEQWADALRARGSGEPHVRARMMHVRRVLRETDTKLLAQLTGAGVSRWIARRREAGMGAQTANHYLAAVKAWTRWLESERHLSLDPLAHLQKAPVDADRRHRRRPATVDEARRLLAAARAGDPVLGVPGLERALIWRTLLETGLREGELARLRVCDLALDADHPTLTVSASSSKHRREDLVQLRRGLALELARHVTGRQPTARAFRKPAGGRWAEMLRADLAAAVPPIEYVDQSGRHLDVHALRHTTATWIADAGVHVSVAGRLMRHRDPKMTLKVYTHTGASNERAALDRMPDLDEPTPRAESAS